jgi:hypothetical protein
MNTVVRRGGEVLRQGGAWTATVHRLLRHVHQHGIDWAPQPQRVETDGREALAYIAGDVPQYPMPEYVWAEGTLIGATSNLRQFHDATVDFDTTDAIWQIPTHEPQEVVCHNDFAPDNFVFNDGRIVGVIDFDTASPGPRIWDLAYLAYRIVPLTSANDLSFPAELLTLTSQQKRLEVLIDAYGKPEYATEIVGVIVERLNDLARFSDRQAEIQARPELADHAKLYRNDATYLSNNIVRRYG